MNIGHTITQEKTGTGGSTVLFSAWFPREADNAIFSFEQIMLEGGSSFVVKVFHKNTEETGEGAAHGGSFSVESDNIHWGTFTALKELVRFHYEVKDGNWGNGPCFVIYRMLAPTWYNTENAT